jgi:hypothetical protein
MWHPFWDHSFWLLVRSKHIASILVPLALVICEGQTRSYDNDLCPVCPAIPEAFKSCGIIHRLSLDMVIWETHLGKLEKHEGVSHHEPCSPLSGSHSELPFHAVQVVPPRYSFECHQDKHGLGRAKRDIFRTGRWASGWWLRIKLDIDI